MPFAYLANGSNTTVKSGPGTLVSLTVGGANGGQVVALDSVSIGAVPDYNLIARSTASNLTVVPFLTAGPFFTALAVPFSVGLTVAATSNAAVTVVYT